MQWQDVIRSNLPYVITNMPKNQSIPTDCRVLCLTDADMLFWLANVCKFVFLSVKDMDEGKTFPQRPRYIKMIRITLAAGTREGVTPVLMPTVLTADTTSKSIVVRSRFCSIEIKNVATTASSRCVVNTAAAFEIASSSIRRLKMLTPSVLVRVERRYRISTAIVVTLIPPAVEPGQPPINIRIMVRN